MRGAEADAREPVADDVEADVPRVGEAVHAADLVAVVGRDRHLRDPRARVDELQQDLGVEVEAVAVLLERDPRERGEVERAVARVPLREDEPRDAVLEAGQDLVADVLVERHPAAARAAGGEHPRPEHDVRPAVEQRGDHLRQHLRRVLAVAVEEHGDVAAVLGQPAVAELLVAAVAEVPALAHDLDRERVVRAPVLERRLVRQVGRVVVAHEHDVDRVAQRVGDPVEDLAERRDRVVRHDEDADASLDHARGS